MDEVTIAGACAAFAQALREGGFTVPEHGWPAELIAAHLCTNNDLIAETAEQIAAGEEPTYENKTVIDDATLQSYAASIGGLAELADALESSARRLGRAWSLLDDATAHSPLPAVIFDAGVVAHEGEIPIREFIEGNASFHLEMHFHQLMALRD